MATTREVARLAMVSAGTVSRVLNHSENVDEALRERVRKAADQLGYRLPPRRNSVADVRSVGFLLANAYLRGREDLMTPFWARVLHGAEEEVARHDVALHYRTIGPDRAEVARSLRSAGLDAVLLVGSATEDVLEAVLSLDVPTALVDFKSQHHALPAVLSDGLDGGQVAVEHLLARGHRRIAFVGGPMTDHEAGIRSVPALQHRYLGYRIALAAAGIPLDPALVAACDLQPEGVTEATEALLERTGFTAMFCANDQTAVAAMRVLGRHGVRVPEDVSVIGYDDDLAEHSIPALTTMSVPKEAMGRLGVRMLLHPQTTRDEKPYTVTLPVELIVRDSVADHREDADASRH